ncbi:hypothetical protein PtB15_16B141 [Puccinia triticina]|nr:hypothetical protein PtB15_16B141 [Puccinia triticina]
MSTSAQTGQTSSGGLPAPRQGRRGRNFGALLTTSDAADSPAAATSSPRQSGDTSRSEASGKKGAGLTSSKKPTPKARKKDKDTPPHQAPAAPQTKDSKRPEQADSARPKPLPSPATNGQSQSLIKHSSPDSSTPASGETCLICAESIKYFALGTCSHRTCHICAIRMRALYKKRDCALCKTELKDVVITTDPQANFASYDLSDIKFKDPHLSIYCETFEQLDELLAYLKFNCPHPDCSSVLQNWKDLKSHTRSVHNGLSLCDLCCSNKKVFAHEHTLFTAKGITVHMNQGSVGVGKGLRRSRLMGDEGPGTAGEDDDGFKGHPRCGFCSVYYYGDDQLYQHCRDKHEQCFICVRNGVGRWQYYLDYQHLESHFRDDHYLCSQSTCLQARFVVYETALELQTHQIEVHGAEMGVKAMKDARKLETNFVYTGGQEQQHSQTHTNRQAPRDQRAGRGIAVMDIPPISGEGSTTLSNANRIVPGLAPNRGRNDSSRPHKGKSKSAPAQEPEDSGQQSSSNTDNINQGGSSSSTKYDVQRHAVLMQRVSEAVNGAEAKTTSFKVAVRTYRNNEMAASDFLDTLCNIFDHRSETIGPILSNLLDLLDIQDERKGQLLERWLDLKLEQTQYPSLDGNNFSKGPSVGNHSNFQSDGSTAALGPLHTSSWVRQQPHYSKLVEKSSRTQNREVPGLVTKKLKSGAKATPWASGSSSTPNTRVNTTNATTSSTTIHANQSRHVVPKPTAAAQNTHFPSLPTKQVPTAKPSWKPNGARPDGGAAQWVAPINELPAGPSSNQASAGGSKKSKKILLFTNSR